MLFFLQNSRVFRPYSLKLSSRHKLFSLILLIYSSSFKYFPVPSKIWPQQTTCSYRATVPQVFSSLFPGDHREEKEYKETVFQKVSLVPIYAALRLLGEISQNKKVITDSEFKQVSREKAPTSSTLFEYLSSLGWANTPSPLWLWSCYTLSDRRRNVEHQSSAEPVQLGNLCVLASQLTKI